MRTILVVDDDADMRELLAFLLEDAGYRVLTAANGREALGLMRTEVPYAVLLDLLMPVMDGWQLRKAMLAERSLASIPVIVITGTTEDERADSVEANQVIEKPLRLPTLLAALSDVG